MTTRDTKFQCYKSKSNTFVDCSLVARVLAAIGDRSSPQRADLLRQNTSCQYDVSSIAVGTRNVSMIRTISTPGPAISQVKQKRRFESCHNCPCHPKSSSYTVIRCDGIFCVMSISATVFTCLACRNTMDG
jgi:hypothetical protein